MLLTPETLCEITRRIQDDMHPDKIIFLGSYAWGEPSDDSDVDQLMIVLDSDAPSPMRAARAHRALRGIPVACDIIVRTRADMGLINPVPASLLYRALTEGKTLHG